MEMRRSSGAITSMNAHRERSAQAAVSEALDELQAHTTERRRVIEEIGTYNPKTEPSTIRVESERAQYWLGVGAQPSEAVEAILKVTGDWQKFKGLPGTEGTLKVKEPKRSKLDIFNEALKDSASEPKAGATPPSAMPGSRSERRLRDRQRALDLRAEHVGDLLGGAEAVGLAPDLPHAELALADAADAQQAILHGVEVRDARAAAHGGRGGGTRVDCSHFRSFSTAHQGLGRRHERRQFFRDGGFVFCGLGWLLWFRGESQSAGRRRQYRSFAHPTECISGRLRVVLG